MALVACRSLFSTRHPSTRRLKHRPAELKSIGASFVPIFVSLLPRAELGCGTRLFARAGSMQHELALTVNLEQSLRPLAEIIRRRVVKSHATRVLGLLSSVSYEAGRSEFLGSEDGKQSSVSTAFMAISAGSIHRAAGLRTNERTIHRTGVCFWRRLIRGLLWVFDDGAELQCKLILPLDSCRLGA